MQQKQNFAQLKLKKKTKDTKYVHGCIWTIFYQILLFERPIRIRCFVFLTICTKMLYKNRAKPRKALQQRTNAT